MRIELYLRKCRLEKNMSIRQLSKKSGISTGAISNIENNITKPNLSTYTLLATALDIKICNELVKIIKY
jgi:transcriptional regulator with XRE-family HTH domain